MKFRRKKWGNKVKKNPSQSLTSQNFNSGRYHKKNINSKLNKLNKVKKVKKQASLYPTSSVRKDKNNDIIVGLDFIHSFSNNSEYSKKSPNEPK